MDFLYIYFARKFDEIWSGRIFCRRRCAKCTPRRQINWGRFKDCKFNAKYRRFNHKFLKPKLLISISIINNLSIDDRIYRFTFNIPNWILRPHNQICVLTLFN